MRLSKIGRIVKTGLGSVIGVGTMVLGRAIVALAVELTARRLEGIGSRGVGSVPAAEVIEPTRLLNKLSKASNLSPTSWKKFRASFGRSRMDSSRRSIFSMSLSAAERLVVAGATSLVVVCLGWIRISLAFQLRK